MLQSASGVVCIQLRQDHVQEKNERTEGETFEKVYHEALDDMSSASAGLPRDWDHGDESSL